MLGFPHGRKETVRKRYSAFWYFINICTAGPLSSPDFPRICYLHFLNSSRRRAELEALNMHSACSSAELQPPFHNCSVIEHMLCMATPKEQTNPSFWPFQECVHLLKGMRMWLAKGREEAGRLCLLSAEAFFAQGFQIFLLILFPITEAFHTILEAVCVLKYMFKWGVKNRESL